MNDRERIDEYLRDEVPPDDAVVVVRGGPIAAEKLIEHAQRQARGYTYRGRCHRDRLTRCRLWAPSGRQVSIFCRPTKLRTTTCSSRLASILKRNDC
jgi:hypothetical protein